MCTTAYTSRRRTSVHESSSVAGRSAIREERTASIACTRRRDPGEWSSSTTAIGRRVATPGEKIAHATASTIAGNHVMSARSHGCPRR
jgi:hypothetical protein